MNRLLSMRLRIESVIDMTPCKIAGVFPAMFAGSIAAQDTKRTATRSLQGFQMCILCTQSMILQYVFELSSP